VTHLEKGKKKKKFSFHLIHKKNFSSQPKNVKNISVKNTKMMSEKRRKKNALRTGSFWDVKQT